MNKAILFTYSLNVVPVFYSFTALNILQYFLDDFKVG